MSTPQPQAPDGAVLAQILIEQGKTNATLAAMTEQLKSLPDHESRLRKLEQWRYGLPLSGLLAASSIALSVYEAMKR